MPHIVVLMCGLRDSLNADICPVCLRDFFSTPNAQVEPILTWALDVRCWMFNPGRAHGRLHLSAAEVLSRLGRCMPAPA